MNHDNAYECWAAQFLDDASAEAALIQFLRNRGVAVAVARQVVPDALQEGLTRILQTPVERWDGYLHFRNAVVRAARHHLVNCHRKRRRERPLTDEIVGGLATGEREPCAIAWLIQLCLEQLAPHEQRLLRQAYTEGLNLREIVEQLPEDGRTPQARLSMVFRERRALLERLRQMLLEGGMTPIL